MVYFPQRLFIFNIKNNMDRISLEIEEMENNRVRIIIYVDGEEAGVMYYELAKRIFNSKPLSMNKWACVDAKITTLYDMVEDMTPKKIMDMCQEELRNYFEQ